MKNKTCCFFGHRKIENKEILKTKLQEIVENLIVQEKVDIFLFGSKSEFDDLCQSVVSQLKEKYPHIKRIYVRAEYPIISEHYKKYLLEDFEETYFPNRAINSGKAVYVERNYEMIDKSNICVIYFKKGELNYQQNSGTSIAYYYAVKKNRKIINTA